MAILTTACHLGGGRQALPTHTYGLFLPPAHPPSSARAASSPPVAPQAPAAPGALSLRRLTRDADAVVTARITAARAEIDAGGVHLHSSALDVLRVGLWYGLSPDDWDSWSGNESGNERATLYVSGWTARSSSGTFDRTASR